MPPKDPPISASLVLVFLFDSVAVIKYPDQTGALSTTALLASWLAWRLMLSHLTHVTQDSCLGVVMPTLAWTFLCALASKTVPAQTCQSDLGNSSAEVPLPR